VSRSKERVAHKRARLERTMIARGVRLIIVDEALRLAEADPRLKTIRSLANTSKATVVLVGAFDLLKCLSSDGQFARRSFPIGFHRYRRSDDSKERDIFSKAVQQLERQFWPFEENPGFSAEFDLFMEATHGCFGMMKDCMSLALAHALRVGEWSPSFRYVGIKSAEQRRTILSEILAGEELWQQCNMDSSDLIKRVAA